MSAVLGMAPWRPTGKSKVIVYQVQQVLDEYRNYLPLTGRQIFYRLVGVYEYPKTEKDYKNLLKKLNRARRARLIPFSAMRDDGVTQLVGGGGYADPDGFKEIVKTAAEDFRRSLWQNQDTRVEVWVEAAGMAPQVLQAVEHLGVSVFSCGGFNSTTMKYESARRIFNRWLSEGVGTAILHVGDHDPSGVSIYENLEADVPEFLRDFMAAGVKASDYGEGVLERFPDGVPTDLFIERVAVTEAQALEMGLVSAPPKESDSRTKNWVGETWQAEAIPPDVLMQMIVEACEQFIDLEVLEELSGVSEQESEQLVEWTQR